MSQRLIIDELDFDVPYGKLAAKTWHEETDECKRVLALHGWMDNAGSFDNIIPYLKHKDGLYVVALDLPGHGKSSQFPPGSSYSDLNIILEIRRCLLEMNWVQPTTAGCVNGQMKLSNSNSFDSIKDASINNDNNIQDMPKQKKFTIIGHSLGAGLGLYYSSLFPNDVEEIILLDFLKSQTFPLEVLLDNTAKQIDKFLTIVPSQSPFASPRLTSFSANNAIKAIDKGQVIVSEEAAIIATIDAHKQLGLLTREDAKCLLKRCTVAVSTPPNSVIYSRDLRLQSMLNFRENVEINKIMFGRVECHALSIITRSGLYTENPAFKDNMEKMREYLKTLSKSFHVQWVEGDHYLHMNNPQSTAEIINKFFVSPANFKTE